MDLECPENAAFKNLCSLRMLKGAGCEEVYTHLFDNTCVEICRTYSTSDR